VAKCNVGKNGQPTGEKPKNNLDLSALIRVSPFPNYKTPKRYGQNWKKVNNRSDEPRDFWLVVGVANWVEVRIQKRLSKPERWPNYKKQKVGFDPFKKALSGNS
jgi:hypothetical protein